MTTDDPRGPTILTWPSKKTFHLFDPSPDEIDIHDIAFSLANQCRYGGHCPFYSNAQHSVLLSEMVRVRFMAKLGVAANEPSLMADAVAAQAELHDAEESYPPGDIVGPFKRADDPGARWLVALQKRIKSCIGVALDIDLDHLDPIIKACHLDLEIAEDRDIRGIDHDRPRALRHTIHPWSPEVARLRFLLQYAKLTGKPVHAEVVREIRPTISATPSDYAGEDELRIRLLLHALDAKGIPDGPP